MGKMLGGSGASLLTYWKTQLPIDYLDASLTINTPEVVSADLSSGKPAKIWVIEIEQTNNGATDETIVLHITMPNPSTGAETVYDVTITTAGDGAIHWVYLNRALATGDYSFITSTSARTMGSNNMATTAIPFTAGYVGLITVEQTSTVDVTTAQIEVNIQWEKLSSST